MVFLNGHVTPKLSPAGQFSTSQCREESKASKIWKRVIGNIKLVQNTSIAHASSIKHIKSMYQRVSVGTESHIL